VTTIDEFISFVNDEVGLELTAVDAELGLDDLPGWDSVHLLALAAELERRTGRQVSLPDLLAAASLAEIYQVAVSA
jgi:acyl carrier protein